MGTDSMDRRTFLKLGGLVAAVAAGHAGVPVAGGVERWPPPGVRIATKKWTMIVDLNKCDGCKVCEEACRDENNVPLYYRRRGQVYTPTGSASPKPKRRSPMSRAPKSGRFRSSAITVTNLHACMSARPRLLSAARRRHRTDRRASLHRLPLLRDRLSVPRHGRWSSRTPRMKNGPTERFPS